MPCQCFLTRQQFERIAMLRHDLPEMPVVESRNPGNPQSFCDGDNRGVYRTERKTAVLQNKFGNARVVAWA